MLPGRVVDADGDPLDGAEVRVGGITATTDAHGRFDLAAFPAGSMTIERPAYESRTVTWDGTARFTVQLTPRIIRPLHVAGWVAASDAGFAAMLDLAANSAVNALGDC